MDNTENAVESTVTETDADTGQVSPAAVAEMASGLAGTAVDADSAAVWLRKVLDRVGEDADRGSVLIAAARFAAADAIDCQSGYGRRVSAAGLSVEGRSAGELAAALRRSGGRMIAPYIRKGGGVVKA